MHRLDTDQFLARPLERVFPFFARPENLALITPDNLNFKLLTPSPVAMDRGRVIDYTITLLGMRVRWRSMITTFQPPHSFVDEQLKGPYSFWHHKHVFEAVPGGTRIRDVVHYALPLAFPDPMAALLHSRYVRPELERIFAFRRRTIQRMFGNSLSSVADTGEEGGVLPQEVNA